MESDISPLSFDVSSPTIALNAAVKAVLGGSGDSPDPVGDPPTGMEKVVL